MDKKTVYTNLMLNSLNSHCPVYLIDNALECLAFNSEAYLFSEAMRDYFIENFNAKGEHYQTFVIVERVLSLITILSDIVSQYRNLDFVFRCACESLPQIVKELLSIMEGW